MIRPEHLDHLGQALRSLRRRAYLRIEQLERLIWSILREIARRKRRRFYRLTPCPPVEELGLRATGLRQAGPRQAGPRQAGPRETTA